MVPVLIELELTVLLLLDLLGLLLLVGDLLLQQGQLDVDVHLGDFYEELPILAAGWHQHILIKLRDRPVILIDRSHAVIVT